MLEKLQIENLKKEVWAVSKKENASPNLLINGDFRINQRKVSTFDSTSQAKSGYFVDRWYYAGIYSTNEQRKGVVTINSDGSINLSCIAKGVALYQRIEQEQTNLLRGSALTLSIKVKNKTGKSPLLLMLRDSGNWACFAVKAIMSDGVHSITAKIPETMSGQICAYLCYDEFVDASSVDIIWVKLEVGNQATEYFPKPYEEELSLCQRFYMRIFLFAAMGIASSTTQAYFLIPTPVTMRQANNINFETMPTLRGNGINKTPTSIIYNMTCSNGVQVYANTSGLATAHVYGLFNGYINIDAEMV